MKDCPVCKSKINNARYIFVMETISNPQKLEAWIRGEWTFEKYMELKWSVTNVKKKPYHITWDFILKEVLYADYVIV